MFDDKALLLSFRVKSTVRADWNRTSNCNKCMLRSKEVSALVLLFKVIFT